MCVLWLLKFCHNLLQLAETLQAENPRVEISAIDVEREGICIRFAPLESAQGRYSVL